MCAATQWAECRGLSTEARGAQERKLEASDKLCQKLFQSGVYWQQRGQRKDAEVKKLVRALQERESGHGPLERKMSAIVLDDPDPGSVLLDSVRHLKPQGSTTCAFRARRRRRRRRRATG